MVGIALSRVLSTAITVVFSPDCVLDIVLPATTVAIVIILKEVSYCIFYCYGFYKKKVIISFCLRRILFMNTICFLLILICLNFIIELILIFFSYDVFFLISFLSKIFLFLQF